MNWKFWESKTPKIWVVSYYQKTEGLSREVKLTSVHFPSYIEADNWVQSMIKTEGYDISNFVLEEQDATIY